MPPLSIRPLNFNQRSSVGEMSADPDTLVDLPRYSGDLDEETLNDIADSVAYEPKYSSSIENRLLSGINKDRRFISGLIDSSPANPWAAVVALGGINRERESIEALDKLRQYAQHERLAKMVAAKKKEETAAEKDKFSNFLTTLDSGPGRQALSYIDALPGGVEGFLKNRSVSEAYQDFLKNHRYSPEYENYIGKINPADAQKRKDDERRTLEAAIREISPDLLGYVNSKFADEGGLDYLFKPVNISSSGYENTPLGKAAFLVNAPDFKEYLKSRHVETPEEARKRIKEEGIDKAKKEIYDDAVKTAGGINPLLPVYFNLYDKSTLEDGNKQKILNDASSPEFNKFQKTILDANLAVQEKNSDKEKNKKIGELKDIDRLLPLYIESQFGGVDKFFTQDDWLNRGIKIGQSDGFKKFESAFGGETSPLQQAHAYKLLSDLETALDLKIKTSAPDDKEAQQKIFEGKKIINNLRKSLALPPAQENMEPPAKPAQPSVFEKAKEWFSSLSPGNKEIGKTNTGQETAKNLLPEEFSPQGNPSTEPAKKPEGRKKLSGADFIIRENGANVSAAPVPGILNRTNEKNFSSANDFMVGDESAPAPGKPHVADVNQPAPGLSPLERLTAMQNGIPDDLMQKIKELNGGKIPSNEQIKAIAALYKKNNGAMTDNGIRQYLGMSPNTAKLFTALESLK